MNFQSAINHITMLAGGSIPGEELLSSAQIAGVTLAGLGIVFACLVLLVFVILIFGKIFEGRAIHETAAACAANPQAIIELVVGECGYGHGRERG